MKKRELRDILGLLRKFQQDGGARRLQHRYLIHLKFSWKQGRREASEKNTLPEAQ